MPRELVRDMVWRARSPLLRLRRATPAFLIIGAQKAGTSSLYEYLARHPQLLANRDSGRGWKEIHFFDRESLYRRGMGWYRAQFPLRRDVRGRLVFEATPEYLFFPEVPERIRRTLGPVPVIAILREPAARAFSGWRMFHSFRESEHPYLRSVYDPRSFAEAIRDELTWEHPPAGYRQFYVARGRYLEQLRRYEAHLGRERMLILDAQVLREDPEAALGKTTAFLGVDPFSEELLAEFRAARFNVGIQNEPIDSEVRTMETLRAYYRPHDEALWDWLGRRFRWAADPATA